MAEDQSWELKEFAMWEKKVHSVIACLSANAWRQANHDKTGRRYKIERPYTVPDEARQLVELLGLHDRQKAEVECKAILEGLRRQGTKID